MRLPSVWWHGICGTCIALLLGGCSAPLYPDIQPQKSPQWHGVFSNTSSEASPGAAQPAQSLSQLFELQPADFLACGLSSSQHQAVPEPVVLDHSPELGLQARFCQGRVVKRHAQARLTGAGSLAGPGGVYLFFRRDSKDLYGLRIQHAAPAVSMVLPLFDRIERMRWRCMEGC